MPHTGFRPNPGNFRIIECKTCGMQMKVLKGQSNVLKIRCRNCKGTRFRTVG